MKKVLVVHYSQTGQLTDIVDAILGPLVSDKSIQIDTLTLQPQQNYPFPWSTQTFCDVFPESVEGVPCQLAPLADADQEREGVGDVGGRVADLGHPLPGQHINIEPLQQA